jgi:oxygen-independent coproporphyrinogen-3 oxidase
VAATSVSPKNHGVENPYIEAVLKEWTLYCKILEKTNYKRDSFGGTTFFLPKFRGFNKWHFVC